MARLPVQKITVRTHALQFLLPYLPFLSIFIIIHSFILKATSAMLLSILSCVDFALNPFSVVCHQSLACHTMTLRAVLGQDSVKLDNFPFCDLYVANIRNSHELRSRHSLLTAWSYVEGY